MVPHPVIRCAGGFVPYGAGDDFRPFFRVLQAAAMFRASSWNAVAWIGRWNSNPACEVRSQLASAMPQSQFQRRS